MTDTVQAAIFLTISSIPEGKVCTYGKIAERAGASGKARYVGHLLKTLPSDSTIPWHRVINSQGKSSFPAHSDKYLEQLALLEQEGVSNIGGKISLASYLWSP